MDVFTADEIQELQNLDPKVQALLDQAKYADLFVSYCEAKQLKPLPAGQKVEWLEWYYQSSTPALFFANGQLVSIDLSEVEDPRSFVVMGEDGPLVVQVEGHCLINRAKDATLPSFEESPARITQSISEAIANF